MRYIIFFLLIFINAGIVLAQQHPLEGKVTDESGKPLPGATIQLEGNDEVTITDVHGHFYFENCPKSCVGFKVSYLGFEDRSIHLEKPISKDLLNIVLHPAVEKLDEVIIRDNYSEQRKNESSLNVEIVNEDYLQRNFSSSLMKSIDRLPGVSSMDIGAGQSKPVIRGLSFNRVVVVENGIKHEGQQWGMDHGLEIDQFSVDHLEVVKGPASLLYGSDAIGGIIDIQPARPPHINSLEGSLQTNYRSNNNYFGSSANLRIRKNKWFADGRFTWVDFADYRVPADTVNIYSYLVPLPERRLRNTAGGEKAFKANIGYLTDKTNSTLYISNVHTKGGLFANAHGLEPRMVDTILHDASIRDIQFPQQEVSHWKVINRTVIQLGMSSLETELGYQRNDRAEFNEYINHGFMPENLPENISYLPSLERGFIKDIFSGQFRSGHQLGQHHIQFSLNSEYQDNRIDGHGFIIPAFKQWTGGLAAYDKWSLGSNWLLHAGVRFDYGRIRTSEYRDWFPTTTDSGQEYLLRAAAIDRSFYNPSWAFGFNYNKDHFHFKLNAGKSFRMPIAKELAANGVNYHHFAYEKGNPELDAENAYQIDISTEWHHEKWAVQLSGFTNYFPNYIYLNPSSTIDLFYGAGNQIFEYQQSEVLRVGGELHAHVNLLSTLKAGVIGEYIFAQQLSGAKKGFTIPFSPPPNATFNLKYQPKLNIKMFDDLYFSADWLITSAQNNIVPPERKTPGYSIFNINAGTVLHFGRQKITLNLAVQNLLNRKYLNHTSFYRLIDLPEAGRNVSISLNIPFHTNI